MISTDRLFFDATNFHKTTCLLGSKFTGERDYDPESYLLFPVLYRESSGRLWRAKINQKGMDQDWMSDQNEYFAPLIVNGAFSIELHLKLLSTLATGSTPKGHHIGTLYSNLPKETKEKIESRFSELTHANTYTKACFDMINDELKIKREWSPSALLDDSNKAFVCWRYAFEDEMNLTSFAGYGEIVHTVRELCKDY